MTNKEVMQMALDALNNFDKGNHGMRWQAPIIKALRAALAQPEHPDTQGSPCPEFWNWLPKAYGQTESFSKYNMEVAYLAGKKAQPEPKPVPMKFQIYKQTPPRGRELKPINSALLPWVYDQDPSSGNTASMWVTPVATLPPQPELEPVAWFSKRPDNTLAIKIVGKPTDGDWEPLYTAPPQREWVGLTDEERIDCEIKTQQNYVDFAYAIEAKLKERNT
jgi:hypothetical protein